MLLRSDIFFYAILIHSMSRSYCVRRKTGLELLTDILVPDVLPEMPNEICKVHFEPNITINVDDVVYFEWIQTAPNVTWTCDPSVLYSLLMTNPLNHQKPIETSKCYHNWFIVDIPGCDIDQGSVYYDYHIVKPEYQFGFKYFVISIFEQLPERPPMPLSVEEAFVPQGGSNCDFSINEFAANYTTGIPVAATMFKMNGTLCEHYFTEGLNEFYEETFEKHKRGEWTE